MEENKDVIVTETNKPAETVPAPVPQKSENFTKAELKAQERAKTRAEKREYKERRRVKRAKKTLRCRRVKNLMWVLTGVFLSIILLVTGVFVGVKLIPIKTYLGSRTGEYVDEEKIGNKSLIDALLHYSEYSMEDLPFVSNTVLDLLSSSGMDSIITLDEEKLKQLKFDSTFADGLLDSVKVSKDLFGTLSELDLFKNVAVDDPDVTESDFMERVKLYYYEKEEDGIIKWERAYNDDGTRVADSEGKQIYLRALQELSIGEMQDLFSVRFQLLTVVSVLNTVGGIPTDSLIAEIVGTRTLKEMGDFDEDDIMLSVILDPDDPANDKIYAVFEDGTGKDRSEISLADLSGFNVDNIKLTTVLPQDSSNAKLYGILVDAIDGATVATDIRLSDLDSFNLNNVKISTIIDSDTGNKVIDKLRHDNTVTIANMGSKANALTLADILSVDVMALVSSTAITPSFVNTDAIYTYNQTTDTYELVSGTFNESTKYYSYTGLDTTKDYYVINKTAGVWFLVLSETTRSSTTSSAYAGTSEWGAYSTIKATGGCTLGNLNSLNVNISAIKIKVLKDLGILDPTMDPSGAAYDLTIEDLMNYAP